MCINHNQSWLGYSYLSSQCISQSNWHLKCNQHETLVRDHWSPHEIKCIFIHCIFLYTKEHEFLTSEVDTEKQWLVPCTVFNIISHLVPTIRHTIIKGLSKLNQWGEKIIHSFKIFSRTLHNWWHWGNTEVNQKLMI